MRKTWLMAPIVVMASFGLVAADSVHPSAAASKAGVDVSKIASTMLEENLYNQAISVDDGVKVSSNKVTAVSAGASTAVLTKAETPNCATPSGDAGIQPWPRQVRTMVSQRFGVTNIGGFRAGDPQDHGKGLALDVMVPVSSALGDSIAAWAIANSGDLNIKYVIWKQRIWMPGRSWKGMEDRGSTTQNHYDHVHLSFNGGSGRCI
ncbi:hypothetical protein [Varibaculum prostatecancerukia]|uniref:hypothetical protein n=1 Tax=Varibaculum prostatecancerukia TaxID=2811781 RepID=UPI001C0025C8|nr:hypothetical protein [Varibaculum prostatecancerukia]